MIDLTGKTVPEIQQATRNFDRVQLAELIWRLVNMEPMFTLTEISRRRRISKDTLLKLIKRGELRAHKLGPTTYRVPLSGIREWDANTALFFAETANGG